MPESVDTPAPVSTSQRRSPSTSPSSALGIALGAVWAISSTLTRPVFPGGGHERRRTDVDSLCRLSSQLVHTGSTVRRLPTGGRLSSQEVTAMAISRRWQVLLAVLAVAALAVAGLVVTRGGDDDGSEPRYVGYLERALGEEGEENEER